MLFSDLDLIREPRALALRPDEAAQALGVCRRTLYAWTKRGLIPYVRVGRAVLYPVSELRAWLRQSARRDIPRPKQKAERT